MSTAQTSTKKSKTENGKVTETDDASKCFPGSGQKLVRFFTGTYEGKVGYIDPTRYTRVGMVPVVVSVKNGVMKKTQVSVWSIAKPHPQKPPNFAVAAAMQIPSFEKQVKLFAKKCVKLGFTKNDNRLNSLIDLFYDEINIAKKKHKSIGVEYDD